VAWPWAADARSQLRGGPPLALAAFLLEEPAACSSAVAARSQPQGGLGQPVGESGERRGRGGGAQAAAVEGIGRPRCGSAKVPECPDAWNNGRQTRPEPHRTVEAAS